jgi:DUF438 domain-containing protein
MVYTNIRKYSRQGIVVSDSEIYQALLENLEVPVVFVDNQHFIRFINAAGQKQYAKYGNILNKSIFDCHNPGSKQKILDIYSQLQAGLPEMLYSENQKQLAFMRAVRDSHGNLLGYYERFVEKIDV